MARYVALATGNWDTVGTWGLVDSTSLLDSETSGQTITTAYSGSRSVSFTPGAITVAGICLKLKNRTGTTGTISAHIALNSTHVEVTGAVCTINTADLPAAVAADNNGGWIYFEFASPVALSGATAYEVEVTTSSASMVDLYRDGTAGNCSRLLVTTANPANLTTAADTFDICKRYTGTGASTAVTVTYDHTATTDLGSGTASSVALTISGATLSYAFAASTNYYMKLSGNLIVYAGATLNIGTVANPIPSTGSAVLEFDPAVDGDLGLIVRNGATFVGQGAAKTPWRLLASDVSASATSMTVDSNVSGWKSGDVIGIASTTTDQTKTETKTLSSDTDATSTIPIAALTNAHDGGNGGPNSASDAAEVVNLTRNVRIRSATSTITYYVTFRETAIIDLDYVEFYYFGANGVASVSGRGIVCYTTTGSLDIYGCSIHDFEWNGFYIVGTTVNNFYLAYNVSYGSSSNNNGSIWMDSVSSGASWSIDHNVVLNNGSGGLAGIQVSDARGSVSYNHVMGFTVRGIYLYFQAGSCLTNFSNNVAHTNGYGIYTANIETASSVLIDTCQSWRNTAYGLTIGGLFSDKSITVTGSKFFGNTTRGFSIECFVNQGKIISCEFNAETTYDQTAGIDINTGTYGAGFWRVTDSTFGSVHAHSLQDIQFLGCGPRTEVELINCLLASSTELYGYPSNFNNGTILRSHKHDQSSVFKSWYAYGIWQAESTTRHTASGFSWKGTPNSATLKLILPGPTIFDTFKTPCPANVARTITVWVQKDGSYNGNAPRLVVVGGIVTGIASDVVGSLTVGASTWEQLSVSVTPTEDAVVEYYVDCDGTAGNIYVDDAAVA